MDDAVVRSLARWPNVPAVYGWLELDRRGNWRIKGERIGNAALRDFIARNYAADERGCWFFQNGPQRVYVALAYTPFVLHFEGERLFDQCGAPASALETWVDDEGSVLIRVQRAVGLLDDRDLERYADSGDRLPIIARAEVQARFGFVARPEKT
ncbi:MAG: hypothetical protein QOD26_170 [Betaproteobacteria bacterium]|jgi:hypothetical protein|nr:hypothetical protein [Betaproteobacteria bacterium]